MRDEANDAESSQRTLALAAIALLALVVFAFVSVKLVNVAERGLDIGTRYVQTVESDSKRIRQHTVTTWQQGDRTLEVDQDRGPTESLLEWHEQHAKSVGVKRDVERAEALAKEKSK